jgi:hypothetical protein
MAKTYSSWMVIGVGLAIAQFAQADFCRSGKACFNYRCAPKEVSSSDECEAKLAKFFGPASDACGIITGDISCDASNTKTSWYFRISSADIDLGTQDKYRHTQCSDDVRTQDACEKVARKIIQKSASMQKVIADAGRDIYQVDCQKDEVPGTSDYQCAVPSKLCTNPSLNGDIWDPTQYYEMKYRCPDNTDKYILTQSGSLVKYVRGADGIPAPGSELTAVCMQNSNRSPQGTQQSATGRNVSAPAK